MESSSVSECNYLLADYYFRLTLMREYSALSLDAINTIGSLSTQLQQYEHQACYMIN